MIMQKNYTALYAYIGDNPDLSSNKEKKTHQPFMAEYTILWRNTEKFWKEQDTFWKAVVAKNFFKT